MDNIGSVFRELVTSRTVLQGGNSLDSQIARCHTDTLAQNLGGTTSRADFQDNIVTPGRQIAWHHTDATTRNLGDKIPSRISEDIITPDRQKARYLTDIATQNFGKDNILSSVSGNAAPPRQTDHPRIFGCMISLWNRKRSKIPRNIILTRSEVTGNVSRYNVGDFWFLWE